VKVEIWSDVVCPWCYIGKRRFETALGRFDHRAEVEVVYRSFELNPNAKTHDEGNLEEALARKYGVSLEQARAMNSRVVDAAAGEGLAYRFDIAKRSNTFDAHRLLQLAAAEGKQPDMKERLMAAYFTEGKAVGDRDTLVGLAEQVGLDPKRARAVLESDEFADQVRADEREASELGITGVPFFVINRRYGVSGAQPPELMLKALNAGWEDAAAQRT
jgi:predicted DsbA family dithiol-disulfide isomerase